MRVVRTSAQTFWRFCATAALIAAAAGPIAADEAPEPASSANRGTGTVATAVGAPVAGQRSDPGAHQTQSIDLGISPYEPVYFSLGSNDVLNAKFQLSLKFRPFGPTDDTVNGTYPWNDLYLAYTQTSVWDLEAESKPFYDTSYRPALFYQRRSLGKMFGGGFSFRGGVEHESNGKGADDSRSINILFIRPSWWWTLDQRWAIAFSPNIYTYVERSENRDIAEYRGYVDWQITLAQERGLRLSTTFRLGTEGHRSALVDLSYPFADITALRAIGLQHGYLHVQYFNGYGETILSYNRRLSSQLRIGLMLVR